MIEFVSVCWYRVLDMFVDNSPREPRVRSVDPHPVRKSLPGLPRAPHQDDLTAGPGSAGVEALNPQPRVPAPPAPGSQNLPGELKTDV